MGGMTQRSMFAFLVLAAVVVGGCKETKPVDDDRGFHGPKKIRRMKMAGSWYPRDAQTLGAELDRYLVAGAVPRIKGRLVGLISPHAGYRYSGPTAAYGYKVLGRQHGVKRVLVLGPSHHVAFQGVSIPNATHYETPFGLLRLDPAAKKLVTQPGFTSLPRAHEREHSVEMQMPFIKRVRPHVRVLPTVVGRMTDALVSQVAKQLAPLVDRHTVIVASSDYTHRGGHFRFEVQREPGESLPAAVKRLDYGTLPFIRALDAPGLRAYYRKTHITMCGREPVAVMLATLKRVGLHPKAQVLHYTTSGYVTGDWRSSVSYLSLALVVPGAGGAK